MNNEEIKAKLAELVQLLGSQRAAAGQLGVSQAYLSDVLAGRRAPGPAILKALGLERETNYKETTK